jgi:hypothetical protein
MGIKKGKIKNIISYRKSKGDERKEKKVAFKNCATTFYAR